MNQFAHAATSIFDDDDWAAPKSEANKPAQSELTENPSQPKSTPIETNVSPPATPSDFKLPQKLTIPDLTARATSRKLFNELFAKELLDRSAGSRRRFSQALLDKAKTVTPHSADEYVLLLGARAAAIEASSLKGAFGAAHQLEKSFAVDRSKLNRNAVAKVDFQSNDPVTSSSNVISSMNLLASLVDTGDFTEANAINQRLRSARCEASLKPYIERTNRDFNLVYTQWTKLSKGPTKITDLPGDAETNFQFGRFKCFMQNQWDVGLPLLAQGSDKSLSALSKSELDRPSDAAKLREIGDTWWEIGLKEPEVTRKRVLRHAAQIYTEILPQTSDLQREALALRIAEGESLDIPRCVDLLSIYEPREDNSGGRWTAKDGTLVSEFGRKNKLEFPYSPPVEYDYAIVLKRNGGDEGICQYCVGGGHQFCWTLAVFHDAVSGFELLQNHFVDNNPTTLRAKHTLVNGVTTVSLIKVRKNFVEAYINEKLVARWNTKDFADLQLIPDFGLPHKDTVGLCSSESSYTIEAAEVIEFSNEGKLLGAAEDRYRAQATEPKVPTRLPDSEQVVDLASRVDLKTDVIQGNWSQSPDGLSTSYWGVLRLGYEPPEEYDYSVSFTATKIESGAIASFLVRHEGLQGEIALLQATDKKTQLTGWATNELDTRGPLFTEGKKTQMLLEVRKDHVGAYVDGNLIATAKAENGNRNTPPGHLDIGARNLGLNFWQFSLTVHDILIKEHGTSGKVFKFPPLGEFFSLNRPLPNDKPKRVVDLLKLTNPAIDSTVGKWEWGKSKREAVSNDHDWNVLRLNYRPPEEYDLRVRLTPSPKKMGGNISMFLSQGSHHLRFDRYGEGCGLGEIDGVNSWMRNKSWLSMPRSMQDGHTYLQVVYVRKKFIAVAIDDKLIMYRPTNYAEFSMTEEVHLGDSLGLGSYRSEYVIHSAEVAEITGEGTVLSGK